MNNNFEKITNEYVNGLYKYCDPLFVRGLYAGDLISKEYKQVGPIKILIKGTQK